MQAQHLWSPGWVFSFQPQGHVLDQGIELTQWPDLGWPFDRALEGGPPSIPKGAPPMAGRVPVQAHTVGYRTQGFTCLVPVNNLDSFSVGQISTAHGYSFLVSLQTRAE